MDHLKDNEKRDRWYARHISPNFVHVLNYSDSNEDEDEDSCSNNEQNGAEQKSRSVKAFVSHDFARVGNRNKSKVERKAIDHLQRFGFVIFSDVLNVDECRHALQLAFDFMEAATAAEKNDVISSGDRSHHEVNDNIFPRNVEGGIIPYYGSGHSSLAWFVRSKPLIKNIFSKLWHLLTPESHDDMSNDVISSMDGVVIWQTPGTTRNTGENERENDDEDIGWFHLDQNPVEKPHFCGLQGLVNVLETTPQTGGNVLIKSSHKLFPSHYTKQCQNGKENPLFYKKRLEELEGDDWMEIDSKDAAVLDPQNIISCLLRPGDLLIWDSRTVHCSHPPMQNGILPNSRVLPNNCTSHTAVPDLVRVAVLVSMMPKIGISSEILQSRRQAVNDAQTLTHWANKAAVLGAERPEEITKEESAVRYMKEKFPGVLLSLSDLTKEQLQLVG